LKACLKFLSKWKSDVVLPVSSILCRIFAIEFDVGWLFCAKALMDNERIAKSRAFFILSDFKFYPRIWFFGAAP
jgi:hypothetical protein